MEEGKPIPRTAVYCIVTCHLGWARWAGKSGKYEGRKEESIVSATISATSSETGQLIINTGKKKKVGETCKQRTAVVVQSWQKSLKMLLPGVDAQDVLIVHLAERKMENGFSRQRETSSNSWPHHAAYFRVRENGESFRVRSKSEGCWWRVG